MLELYLLKLPQTTKYTSKNKHHENQHDLMECLCFDKKPLLEDTCWHVFNQLSPQTLTYSLTARVTDTVLF